MADRRSLRYAKSALAQIDEISAWNEEVYGGGVRQVSSGEVCPFSPESSIRTGDCRMSWASLRSVRKRNRAHGHLAVYRFDEDFVDILHVFHTAQDWASKIT